MGEVILTSEESEKGEGEDARQGLMGSVFGAGIGNLTENLGKMGEIIVYRKPP